MFWGEPSWNCCVLCIKSYVVLQNSRSWPSSSLPLRTEGYEFPRETFSWVHTKLKDKHILGTFISKPCRPEQSPDLSRLPSLFPLFSVCQPVLCPTAFLSGELPCFAKNERFFSFTSVSRVTEVQRRETCGWGLLVPTSARALVPGCSLKWFCLVVRSLSLVSK